MDAFGKPAVHPTWTSSGAGGLDTFSLLQQLGVVGSSADESAASASRWPGRRKICDVSGAISGNPFALVRRFEIDFARCFSCACS